MGGSRSGGGPVSVHEVALVCDAGVGIGMLELELELELALALLELEPLVLEEPALEALLLLLLLLLLLRMRTTGTMMAVATMASIPMTAAIIRPVFTLDAPPAPATPYAPPAKSCAPACNLAAAVAAAARRASTSARPGYPDMTAMRLGEGRCEEGVTKRVRGFVLARPCHKARGPPTQIKTPSTRSRLLACRAGSYPALPLLSNPPFLLQQTHNVDRVICCRVCGRSHCQELGGGWRMSRLAWRGVAAVRNRVRVWLPSAQPAGAARVCRNVRAASRPPACTHAAACYRHGAAATLWGSAALAPTFAFAGSTCTCTCTYAPLGRRQVTRHAHAWSGRG